MDKDSVIKVENVSKTFKLPHNKQNSIKGALVNLVSRGDRTYETQEVLKKVSFEIKKGEFFGIVGRNGSGKSTLLKLLAGIYTPTKGTVTVNGSLTPFIELGVGFNPELTGRENVYMNGALLGFNNKEVDQMYSDIVEFAELERFMDQKLKNYSSGMHVRLAFSIAIRARSDILLLDEVLAVGDAAFQQKCYDYFMQLKAEKRTVVLVTHDMSSVQKFCDKAIYLEEGRIKLNGSANDVADMYITANAMAEDKSTSEAEGRNKSCKLTVSKPSEIKNNIIFRAEISIQKPMETYLAFSILKDGGLVSVLSSEDVMTIKKSKVVTYTLDTSHFNAGIYQLSAGLFSLHNRELLSLADRVSFTVAGPDITRGGALRLEHAWKEEK